MSIFGIYYVTSKMTINDKAFPISGRHLGVGFPVDEILSLNVAFRSGTSGKHMPLYISRFQRYGDKSDLGSN